MKRETPAEYAARHREAAAIGRQDRIDEIVRELRDVQCDHEQDNE